MNPSSPALCPRCGAAIEEHQVDGLCARCLGALNFSGDTAVPGNPAVPGPPLPPDQLAPHFPQLEILECLGRGGMGVVYKARQKSLNRLVALKLLAPERAGDPLFAARFEGEAQALAALNHPNIVDVHDFGQAGGFYFLLMEFVDGVTLRQAMNANRFTPEQALAVVPPVCEALQFAHDHGIVHRDIKPENLLLGKDGRVRIADFGIAKMLGDDSADGATDSQPAGTPQYMAPEQRDHHPADHRADIYSLGVVLYELLTGELPGKPIEPPSRKVRIDVRLDEVVLRALEEEPERRYQQVSEVRTNVETIAALPTGTAIYPKSKPGMVRLIERFFDLTFTSPLAAALANASALGFLGFLSGLKHLPLPGSHHFSGLGGFYGFFGLIGVAVLIELTTRRRKPRFEAEPQRDRRRLGWLSLGLFLAGLLGTLILLAIAPVRDEIALVFGGVALLLALVFGLIGWRDRPGRFVAVVVLGLLVSGGSAVFFFTQLVEPEHTNAELRAEREKVLAETRDGQARAARIAVEDLALRLLAAVRDKEDAVLRELAVDRVDGWREALPQFAFELRERSLQLTGKPFAIFPADSLVSGDCAVVRCLGPDELQGFYLVLAFVRTPEGWRNWSLRNSPPSTPLQQHFDEFRAQLDKFDTLPQPEETK